jgi:hypothetical protein
MQTWRDEIQGYLDALEGVQLHEESPRAEQPTWIRTPLRPHQQTLLAAARSLEERAMVQPMANGHPQLLTRYGVLADRVGAGKSLVALSLVRDPPVARTTAYQKESGEAVIMGVRQMPPVAAAIADLTPLVDLSDNQALGSVLCSRRGERYYARTAFLLVGHNVMTQWEEYITAQTDLKALFIKRTKDCTYDRPGFLRDVFSADVVVCSCTMLRKFIGAMSFWGRMAFPNIVWSRVFIDEADTVTCSLRLRDIEGRFFWFITGSWLNMAFPYGLRSYDVGTLDGVHRATVGDGVVAGLTSQSNIVAMSSARSRDPAFAPLILRNRADWIDKSLAQPVIVHETVMCRAPPNIQLLSGFITPAAMEALHAGDTAGAMAALGLKGTGKESLADRVTASLRGELLQAEKILGFKRELEYSSASAKEQAIVKATEKVTRLREQLVALETRVASATSELCPICYDSPRTATLTPCCRNVFCLSCLCECIQNKPACPLCRQSIGSVRDLVVIGEEEEGGAGVAGEEEPLPTKGAALLLLLEESTEDQRYLVFSSHEASFRGLRDLLSARGVRCEMLQGTAARVDRLRRQFREGTVRVLCMNAKHVGAGINLEAATHVVLYHRMNVEMERQVIGRAVRFERASELRVVHLVHEHETAANGAAGSEVIVHV